MLVKELIKDTKKYPNISFLWIKECDIDSDNFDCNLYCKSYTKKEYNTIPNSFLNKEVMEIRTDKDRLTEYAEVWIR